MDEFVSCFISISVRKPLQSYGGIVFKKYRLLILLYETPDILSCTQRRIPHHHHHHLFLQATRQTCSSKLNSPSLPPPPAKRSEPVTLPRSPPVAQHNFFFQIRPDDSVFPEPRQHEVPRRRPPGGPRRRRARGPGTEFDKKKLQQETRSGERKL